jgi:DnaJ-class molecular chaperone
MTICPECDGDGQRWYEVKRYGGPPGAYSPFEDVFMTCERCDGTGEVRCEEEDDES